MAIKTVIMSQPFEQYQEACLYMGRYYASTVGLTIIQQNGAWYIAKFYND